MNDSKNDTLLDRAFNQIDTNSNNILELTRLTGQHSSSISILKKILIGILLFIVITALSTVFVGVKESKKVDKIKNSVNAVESIGVNKTNDEGN